MLDVEAFISGAQTPKTKGEKTMLMSTQSATRCHKVASVKIADVMYKMVTYKVLLDKTEFNVGTGVFLYWFPKSDSYLLELRGESVGRDGIKELGTVKCQRLFSKLGKAVAMYNNWIKDFPKV